MRRIPMICLLLAVLILTGCSVQTVDDLYSPPKRSEQYNNLQSSIDNAMTELEYSAPLAGEYQQAVQMADLDGDGTQEYLLFAKGNTEKPLKILIFRELNGTYTHVDTIESNGTSFDQIEYMPMDDRPGMEIVVGRQLSGQVLRSVSVYTYTDGKAEQLLTVNYTKFLSTDLDENGSKELFVLRPGVSNTDNGVAEFYSVREGAVERSNEVNMSQPADMLKRIVVGRLHEGCPAVYVASTVGDTAIITDVYACVSDMLTNVTFSNESGTSVQTMRNYYVYADDIDFDGIVELPHLMTMKALAGTEGADRHDLIRWYAMKSDGGEVDKMCTYHNFVGGWYMRLDSDWAPRLTVVNVGYRYEFYIWNETYTWAEKVMTVYALTGQNREEQSRTDDRFVLLKTESVIYAADLEDGAQNYGIQQRDAVESFRLIRQDWKTGET